MAVRIDTWNGEDLWICGGRKTYLQWLPYIERFYISRIDYSGQADVFMPELCPWVQHTPT